MKTHLLSVLLALSVCVMHGQSVHAQTKPASAQKKSTEKKAVKKTQNDPNRALQKAYQREYAYLLAQKEALLAQKKALQSELKNRQASAERDNLALEDSLLAMSLRTEKAEEGLDAITRMEEVATDQEDRFSNLQEQVNRTLSEAGLEKIDFATSKNAFPTAIQNVVTILNQRSSVRTEKGSFFAADGKKVEGTILRIGEIAAYGASADVAGALAPAGNQTLKVWPDSDPVRARALVEGHAPVNAGVFLFESLEKGVEPREEKTALGIIQAGGIVAYVIVGIGCFALLLCFLRFLILLRVSRKDTGVLHQVFDALVQKDVKTAVDASAQLKGPLGRIFTYVLAEKDKSRDEKMDRFEGALIEESQLIDRFGSFVLVIAAVAPLLGLLGTVTGMIATFDIITEFGTGDPKLLSSGISEALITTELGLIVAIPSLLLGNVLNAYGEKLKQSLEINGLKLIDGIPSPEPMAPSQAMQNSPKIDIAPGHLLANMDASSLEQTAMIAN